MIDERVPLWHVLCGEIAFFAKRRLTFGEIIAAEDFEFPDGSQPVFGDDIRCGACGELGTEFGPIGEFRPDEVVTA